MMLKDYQNFARSTAVYPSIIVLKNPTDDQIKRCQAVGVQLENISWVYPLIGLFGEAGELANNLKKVIRDNSFQITKEKRMEVMYEKGDLAWYNIILDHELNLDPDIVLEMNKAKLLKRKESGTLHDKGRKR